MDLTCQYIHFTYNYCIVFHNLVNPYVTRIWITAYFSFLKQCSMKVSVHFLFGTCSDIYSIFMSQKSQKNKVEPNLL